MNTCILPAGAWGTALAIHLNRLGHTVTLVPHTLEEAMEMGATRENRRFFPGHALPADLQIGFEARPALMEARACILACPSQYLRSVCRRLRAELDLATELEVFITICKGLEEGTNQLPSEILEEELPGYAHGVLSGPTFASQVAEGQPSALVLATNAAEPLKQALQEAISSETLRVYTSTDMIGDATRSASTSATSSLTGPCNRLLPVKRANASPSVDLAIRIVRSLAGSPI